MRKMKIEKQLALLNLKNGLHGKLQAKQVEHCLQRNKIETNSLSRLPKRERGNTQIIKISK